MRSALTDIEANYPQCDCNVIRYEFSMLRTITMNVEIVTDVTSSAVKINGVTPRRFRLDYTSVMLKWSLNVLESETKWSGIAHGKLYRKLRTFRDKEKHVIVVLCIEGACVYASATTTLKH